MLPGTFDLDFTAGLMMKDMKLFLAESRALGVPAPVIEAVARQFDLTCTELGPDADLSAVAQPLEHRARITLRDADGDAVVATKTGRN